MKRLLVHIRNMFRHRARVNHHSPAYIDANLKRIHKQQKIDTPSACYRP